MEMPAYPLQSETLQPTAMWNRCFQNRSVRLGAVAGLKQRRPMQISGLAVLLSISMRPATVAPRRYRPAASPGYWHHGTDCERGDRGGRPQACIRDPVPAGRGPRRECPQPGPYPRALCFDWISAQNTPCDPRPILQAALTEPPVVHATPGGHFRKDNRPPPVPRKSVRALVNAFGSDTGGSVHRGLASGADVLLRMATRCIGRLSGPGCRSWL